MKIHEVIVVEGKYDVNMLKQVVDAVVISTDGFQIFQDRERQALLRRLAETRGLIVLTDSDGGGFVIRNFLKGILPENRVKHAYIPERKGRERRKSAPGKEGLLGVEGMDPETLRRVLCRAGATIQDRDDTQPFSTPITKADLMQLGLSAGPDSAEKRRILLRYLEFPEKMTANALLQVANLLMDRKSFFETCNMLFLPASHGKRTEQDDRTGGMLGENA